MGSRQPCVCCLQNLCKQLKFPTKPNTEGRGTRWDPWAAHAHLHAEARTHMHPMTPRHNALHPLSKLLHPQPCIAPAQQAPAHPTLLMSSPGLATHSRWTCTCGYPSTSSSGSGGLRAGHPHVGLCSPAEAGAAPSMSPVQGMSGTFSRRGSWPQHASGVRTCCEPACTGMRPTGGRQLAHHLGSALRARVVSCWHCQCTFALLAPP